MKKFMFSAIALVAFSVTSFAGEVKDVKKEEKKTIQVSLIKDSKLPIFDGSYTFTDACGDTYLVTYVCNYDCEGDVKAIVAKKYLDSAGCVQL